MLKLNTGYSGILGFSYRLCNEASQQVGIWKIAGPTPGGPKYLSEISEQYDYLVLDVDLLPTSMGILSISTLYERSSWETGLTLLPKVIQSYPCRKVPIPSLYREAHLYADVHMNIFPAVYLSR